MPKSKHRRNGKPRPTGRATRVLPTPSRSPLYDEPCPDDLLIEEFGEEGADWLVAEYERPLNRADLELEKAIRNGHFTLEHPTKGPVPYTLEDLSTTLWATISLVLKAARQQGLLTDSEVEKVGGGGNLADDAVPVCVRDSHAGGFLYLNQRGLWDFGEGE